MKCYQCQFASFQFSVNDTTEDNVSVILRLIANTNITLSADCLPLLTITSSGDPPYESGDNLTCAAEVLDEDGDDIPSYEWIGINGGSSFYSKESTVTLLAGEFCLYCIARFEAVMTKEFEPDHCSAFASVCDSAIGKY